MPFEPITRRGWTVFAYLRFRWDLWQLEREQRKIGKKYEAMIKDANARKLSVGEIDTIEYEGTVDSLEFQENIWKLHSRYLCRQAARVLLPTPDLDNKEMWEHEPPNRVYLTEKGINHTRAAIRAERKARAEMFLMYVPGIVGILGTLIGLTSILVKH
jgi:hypothetical protein